MASNSAELLFLRAEEHFSRAEVREALCCYEKAFKAGFESDRAAFQRWTCYMLMGRFKKAWEETDRTESIRRRLNLPQDHLPLHLRRVWNGETLRHRRVLVRCYHGLGDTIQFIRYIPSLARIARRVFVQCPRELWGLIGSVAGIDALIRLEDPQQIPGFDVEIELMELPYAFRTTLASIPCEIPYIYVPAETAGLTGSKLAALEHSRKLRVGLAWRSGNWNHLRSVPIEEISKLTKISAVDFFSLQVGAEMRDVPFGSRKGTLIQAEELEPNLIHTAAVIQNLDLVVSVDTMVAHLAGALGKPVWVLLPFDADWRWMVHRMDSPWYPTMRLYRQPHPNDWQPVLATVARDLSRSSKSILRR